MYTTSCWLLLVRVVYGSLPVSTKATKWEVCYKMHGSLPAKLRVLRAREGLYLTDAAKKIGIGRDTLAALERGERRPAVPTLRKIADAYGVPVDELLEEELVGPPKAEAPPETGPTSSPLLEDPRVVDWLQGQDAAFVLMSDKDFEDVVVS